METFIKGAEITIAADGAAVLTLKTVGAPAVTLNAEDGIFLWNSADAAVGKYTCRYIDGNGRCIRTSELEILKPYSEMSDDEDPRSDARKTLDAIDAALAGRASVQQRKVQVGDRTIEYSTINELLKWRHYYALKVAQEEGVSYDYIKKFSLSRGR